MIAKLLAASGDRAEMDASSTDYWSSARGSRNKHPVGSQRTLTTSKDHVRGEDVSHTYTDDPGGRGQKPCFSSLRLLARHTGRLLPASKPGPCVFAGLAFCRPRRRFVAPGPAATGTAAQLQATEACGSHAGAGAIAHDGSSRGAVPEDEAILYTPEFKVSHKAVTTLLSQEPRATQRTVRQH